MIMKKELLFVQPNFPTPNKSINHSSFLPISLLKLITYYRQQGYHIDDSQLVKGEVNDLDFTPKKIFITTLFTYWYDYVKRSMIFYREKFPSAEIHVGGILATLLPDKLLKVDPSVHIHSGVNSDIEKIAYQHGAAYDVVDKYGVDYQIVHAMRGCIRKCKFCGTWKIEQRKDYDIDDVISYIIKCATVGRKERRKVIFYDNNFFAHHDIENLLQKLAEVRINGKHLIFESQSGFDGRILLEKPDLANLIKKARFRRPKIAWDNSIKDIDAVKEQVDILLDAGYHNKEISVFMIYNWQYPLEVMLKKLKSCWEWQIQIADCRFRPLNSLKDNYNPHLWRYGQTCEDYYIYTKKGWTDQKVRLFRKLVRQQNIMIRQQWGPGQYEQWRNNQQISKTDDSGLIWPDCFIRENGDVISL